MTRFTHYEFFCGGGMARVGLGPDWRCLLANDLDPAKCAVYRANFGGEELVEGDIHDLTPADLPGRADMAWASFPCQDLSLAGARSGLDGGRSAAFWGFRRLIQGLRREARAPRTLVIENVVGFASSRGGADLALALGALAEDGYRFDVKVLDAASFLPQSRPRLFIVAWTGDADAPVARCEDDLPSVARALSIAPNAVRAARRRLGWPAPPATNLDLDAVVETDAPYFDEARAEALLAMTTETQRAKLADALARAARRGEPVYGALFRRMRGGEQRAEIRFDRAGCLRTPAGGSSKQVLVAVRPDGSVRLRHFTGREAARLMGLPDDYRLPGSTTQTLKLAGDGVAVPVVRYIAEAALEPLLSRSLEPAADGE